MKHKIYLLALVLASCTHQSAINSQPVVTDTQTQLEANLVKKPNVAKDWSEIANQVAQRTYDTLKELKLLNQPITVVNEQNSTFSNAMHELVKTELVNKGVIVKTGTDKRFYLSHDTNYITLSPNGAYMKSFAKSGNQVPNVKVMITSSLIKDGVYMMRSSEDYYVDGTDIKIHAESNQYLTKDLKVVNRCGDKECGK